MKKLLLILALFYAFCFQADATIIIRGSGGGGGENCTGLLVCQNFEGTGYDNSETWNETGNVNPDYTGTVLRGSQSFNVAYSGGNAFSYIDFAATNPLYGFFRYNANGLTAGFQQIFKIKDASNDVLSIEAKDVSTVVTFQVKHGTVTATSGGDYTTGTTYYIWWDYASGSGADGVAHVYISANTTKPAATITIENGNGTTSGQRAYMLSLISGVDSIFDQIYVDDAAIGNVSN